MADNTRVNEIQDKFLQAMDIVNAKALKSLSYDKTITCTIENDKDKKDGKYEVTDGSTIFTAYSKDSSYRKGEVVYVTIPQGDYENQKMIIGKKTSKTEKPFNFVTPFDLFFPMTENISKDSGEASLVANYSDNATIKVKNNLQYINYTRLGIKADFRSWVKNAVEGSYGINISLTTKKQNAVGEEPTTHVFYYQLDNKQMYGNPYNFETYYNQEIILDIEHEQIGQITDIEITFQQENDFKDQFGVLIPYQTEDGDILAPNLFVKNVEIYLGYDISIFTNDYVEIYTSDRNSYRRSVSTEQEQIDKDLVDNRKNINMRWVHIVDGEPINAITNKDKITDNYEVRWYKYRVGAPAADEYSGIYWARMFVEKKGDNEYLLRDWTETDLNDEKPQFGELQIFQNLIFNPDVNKQQEKIKAIIIYNNNIPYRSNDLIFENEEDLPPSQEAQHIMSALNIVCEDDTNGNYMIYGQDNSIKDTEYGKITRTLTAWFDTNNDGIAESEIQDLNNVIWTIPAQSSMIKPVNTNLTDIIENEKVIAYQLTGENLQYTIASYYTPNSDNNTITCQYKLNNVIYTTEKEFTFGPSGTMGSSQTLVIDFVGDKKAIDISLKEKVAQFEVCLYNNQNIKEQIPSDAVNWKWYYNSDLNMQLEDFPIDIVSGAGPILELNYEFKIESLYILQATIGSLTTYFPIPIKNEGCAYIKGPTQVVYQSSGEPSYNKDSYKLYYIGEDNNEQIKSDVKWRIKSTDTVNQDQGKYDATLTADYRLQPIRIYTRNASPYGVQAYISNIAENGQEIISVLWTQPILVMQNLWPSNVINSWDGKTVQIDESNGTILSQAIAAGHKDSLNRFSGVMIGSWKGTDTASDITAKTGVYGFHQGAMSYAWKDDGTGFIGKDGLGRINFDGNKATIYSSEYKINSNGSVSSTKLNGSMTIDLNEPYIEMERGGNQILIDASKTGDVTSANSSNAPFKIGSKFAVAWDGTIYATNGNFTGTIKGSTLASSSDTIYLQGTLTVQGNENNSWNTGGYLGYMEADFGGQNETDNGQNNSIKQSGIGMRYNNGGIVKATSQNAGLSFGTYYLSIQEGKAVLRNIIESGPRLILDDSHIGLGYGGSANNKGSFISLQVNGSTDEIIISADKIEFQTPRASDQTGIYARFA